MNRNTSVAPPTSTNAEVASTDSDETASSSRTLGPELDSFGTPKENTTGPPTEAAPSLSSDSAETEASATSSPPPLCVATETGTESTDGNLTPLTSTGPVGVSTDTPVTPSPPKAIMSDAALNVNVPLTTVAEPTDMTAATVTGSSEHDQFTGVPITGAIQATGAVHKAVFVSTGGLTTKPGSMSTRASLFTSTEPTEQQTTTSAEDEEFLV